MPDKGNVHTFPFRHLDYSKTLGDVSNDILVLNTEKNGSDARTFYWVINCSEITSKEYSLMD